MSNEAKAVFQELTEIKKALGNLKLAIEQATLGITKMILIFGDGSDEPTTNQEN